MNEKHLTYAGSGVDIKQEENTIKALTSKMTYVRTGLGAPLTISVIMQVCLILENMPLQ
jgi:phosphoribosylformylglycinamidine cyclo-ligase